MLKHVEEKIINSVFENCLLLEKNEKEIWFRFCDFVNSYMKLARLPEEVYENKIFLECVYEKKEISFVYKEPKYLKYLMRND